MGDAELRERVTDLLDTFEALFLAGPLLLLPLLSVVGREAIRAFPGEETSFELLSMSWFPTAALLPVPLVAFCRDGGGGMETDLGTSVPLIFLSIVMN